MNNNFFTDKAHHRDTKMWIGAMMERESKGMNVLCNPLESDFL